MTPTTTPLDETTLDDVAFASDFGWEPGFWPLYVTWRARQYRRASMVIEMEDMIDVLYIHEPTGSVLVVYND